ncbi:MAG: S-layer homology domain-containing protein [Clostridia bacterium]
MKKKILSTLLALAMIVGMIPTVAFAEASPTNKDLVSMYTNAADTFVITFDANYGTSDITSAYVTEYEVSGDTLAYSLASSVAYTNADDTLVYEGIDALPTPVRSGYTFNGWYYDVYTVSADTVAYKVDFDTTVFEADTTVTASWTRNSSSSSSSSGSTTTTTTTTDDTTSSVFSDVDSSSYYYDAIAWAVENGITFGVSDTEFGVGQTGAREQVMTFLWRLAGEPDSESENVFSDLDSESYYYTAILWAIENGITNGMSDDSFGTGSDCTRSQIVTFLWRYAGCPDADTDSFADVDADSYYASAVAWAVENAITNGTGDDTFAPEENCTREQIVTFLYRYATM